MTDEPILARMKRIGIERGKSFDLGQADPAVRQALERAPEAARKLMRVEGPHHRAHRQRLVDEHRHHGSLRQLLPEACDGGVVGLGANLPEDAVYPLNLGDATGKPLDGRPTTRCISKRVELPPAGAFWSVTLYDADGFQVANRARSLRAQQLDAVQDERRRFA